MVTPKEVCKLIEIIIYLIAESSSSLSTIRFNIIQIIGNCCSIKFRGKSDYFSDFFYKFLACFQREDLASARQIKRSSEVVKRNWPVQLSDFVHSNCFCFIQIWAFIFQVRMQAIWVIKHRYVITSFPLFFVELWSFLVYDRRRERCNLLIKICRDQLSK